MSAVKKLAAADGPRLEIVSTLVYSHGLAPNPALPNEPRQCLLLRYAVDRLLLAASEFKWPRVLALLGHARAPQALLREIEAHLC
ncbi:hypothetical protein HRG_011339 [Hirsutella rhossiliensis]|uniref:Uncharacterized protein n=1 Tax=Hirsutella rhossiliensis TaxID=111463 RepID=A0A9P8MLJ7_9HYPO|nr:uncharacterized protein HRG_11339 [Hirsutella rhossiliensis]KAH0957557.1 hypothetical protein HRG_11339 [Hirsutella rhossiliensis]